MDPQESNTPDMPTPANSTPPTPPTPAPSPPPPPAAPAPSPAPSPAAPAPEPASVEPAGPVVAVPETPAFTPKTKKGCFFYGCTGSLILLLVVGLTAGITFWWLTHGPKYKPVVLEEKEQVVLEKKMEVITRVADGPVEPIKLTGATTLDPVEEKAAEVEEKIDRTIIITERELNSIFHEQSELGDSFRVTLGKNSITVKMSHQMADDAIIFPGKNMRGKLGIYLAREDGELVLRVHEVNIAGIPVPGPWLEGLGIDKDVNLLEDFFGDAETTSKFSEGIKEFRVERGQILIELAE